MRHWIVYCSFTALFPALHLKAQLPQPAVPDNTLNATNTIGLPPAASREGTSEVVNLTNGALNFFLPALTLPQRAGSAALELGFTYDSNQQNLQQTVTAEMGLNQLGLATGGWGPGNIYSDYIYYTPNVAPTTFSGGPLDMNIPQLSASMEYEGDWQIYAPSGDLTIAHGSYYCLTNVSFRDWKGTTHAFPHALIACNQEQPTAIPGMSEILTDNSNDNQFYHLDATNRLDYIVYAPDGTAYHFAHPGNLPCGTLFGTPGGYCLIPSSEEQYLHVQMTSSVDRFSNTITFSQTTWDDGILTDTVGRTVQISGRGTIISYKDSNGVTQTVSQGFPSTLQSPPTVPVYQVPGAVGNDVGPALRNGTCFVGSTGGPFPTNTVYVFGPGSISTSPPPPANRAISGIPIYYSSTGQYYALYFDSFDHLLEIRYPEGGYHRYDYAEDGTYLTQPPAICSWPVVEVAHRFECAIASGSCTPQQEAVTTYTPFVGNPTNTQMIVQDPDGAVTVHNFGLEVGYMDVLSPVESDVYQYASLGGTLLRQTHNDYASAILGGKSYAAYPFPIQVTTTLKDVSPNLSSVTTYAYDTLPQNIDQIFACGAFNGPQCATVLTGTNIENRTVENPVSTSIYDYGANPINSTTESWLYLTNLVNGGSLIHEPASTTISDAIQAKQKTQTITHDAVGRVTAVIVGGTGVSPLTTAYTPDGWGRPTAIQDPKGNITQYGYTDNWADSRCYTVPNLSSYITSVTNAANQATHYSYYTCTGQLATSTDPNGVTVSFAYDGASRITQRQVASGSVVNDLTVSYQDGPNSTITRTELSDPNPSTVTMYSLDGLGRVYDQSVQSDPLGATHVTTYFNTMGQVQGVTNPYRSQSDATYGITSYLYDSLGRKTFQCQPDDGGANALNCAHTNSYLEWNYAGNVVTNYDESRREWKHTTDALGRLTSVAELGSATAPLNLQTVYTYDGFGNLLTANQNGQTGDVGRQQRRFTYDGLSRLACASNPENSTGTCPTTYSGTYTAGTTGYVFDAVGNIFSKTDARGVTTNYGYDSLSRLVSKTYANAPAGSLSSCYAFDTATNGIGRLGAEWTQAGTCPSAAPTSGFQTKRTFIAYDPMGRIVSEQQCVPNASGLGKCAVSTPTPFSLTYGYDMAGNLALYTNGVNSIMLSSQYDGAGRLSSVTSTWSDTLHPPTLFTVDPTNGYTAGGALQNFVLGNSIFVTKTYNNRLRTTGAFATHP